MNPFGPHAAPTKRWYLVEFWGSCFASGSGDAVRKLVGTRPGRYTVRRLDDDALIVVGQ